MRAGCHVQSLFRFCYMTGLLLNVIPYSARVKLSYWKTKTVQQEAFFFTCSISNDKGDYLKSRYYYTEIKNEFLLNHFQTSHAVSEYLLKCSTLVLFF